MLDLADELLVGAALRGDREAFGALVDRHRPRAQALARRTLGDAAEAEDVVQEAVLRAYLGLGDLRDPSRFGAWLGAIALNLARMRRRAARPLERLDEAPAREPESEEDADALELLPEPRRELLLMRYVDGLSAGEIGTRVGRSAGAVRVELHRARTQLRQLLRKEIPMVEITIEDVLVRASGESVFDPTVKKVILLREKNGERRLPIWVGGPEAMALALHLGSELPMRPLTIDLAARLLDATHGRVERVVVNRLHEKTFYATVAIANGGGTSEVDARPSDALNLAVRVGAPIYVDDEVFAGSSFVSDDVGARLDEEGIDDGEGEWHSLSAESVVEFMRQQSKP
jgi:RNA polymerase sigma factor (sigma-70 family)